MRRTMLFFFRCVVEKIDPCESREDPVVCAALVGSNAYIDLDDVLEAEKEFWKVISTDGLQSRSRRRKQTVGSLRRFASKKLMG